MATEKPDPAAKGSHLRSAAALRTDAAKRAARRLKATLGILIGAVVVGLLIVAAMSPSDSDISTSVPPPVPAERTEAVAMLKRAHTSQKICYGWRLSDNSRWEPVSVGSNLGDGVKVDSDRDRCPRWVEISASVNYTTEASEDSDSARYEVTTSTDLAHIDFERGLDRLGLDPDDFIDDPGWAICRGAGLLPLLVGEAEAAPTPPTPAPPAAGQPAPPALPDPGNDFWRSRGLYLLGTAGVFLLTALFLAIGWFERRAQRRPAAVRDLPPTSGVRASASVRPNGSTGPNR